jgi:hypothetical protein
MIRDQLCGTDINPRAVRFQRRRVRYGQKLTRYGLACGAVEWIETITAGRLRRDCLDLAKCSVYVLTVNWAFRQGCSDGVYEKSDVRFLQKKPIENAAFVSRKFP